MRRSLQIFTILGSWLLATGMQWDALQIIAWGRMLAENSQEMTFAEAVDETFFGEACALCRTADEGRRQEQQSSDLASARERMLLLPFRAEQALVVPVGECGWSNKDNACVQQLRQKPPTPPPRSPQPIV